jgi:predicted alpha/beta superfamily hydrolase
MKNLFTLLTACLLSLIAFADNVTIIVVSTPDNTPPEDNIYIAGNFNGWNPGDPDFVLTENASAHPEINLEGTGSVEFKFTRGSWETVEGNENGGFLPNRTFSFGTADTLEITILSWEDLGGSNHTAAENVVIIDEDFYIPQLNRYRRIWVYYPPDYDSSGKDYPVLYMHDGQNLFDAATSFAGEWEVDETLNEMYDQGMEVPLVVGIDNGGADRIDEYTPWPNPQYGGGDGDLYAQFIVETLKPFIDENFRTLPDRDHTGVMGSSLGGLISHYMAVKYQDVFSKAGIFSPSYWYTGDIYDFTYETGKTHDMRFYVMGGTDESAGLVEDIEAMLDTLQAAGFGANEMTMKVVEGGQHNEALWRQEFGEAYEWMYLNGSTDISDHANKEAFEMVFNDRKLMIKNKPSSVSNLTLKIFTLSGQMAGIYSIRESEEFQIPNHIKNGIYIFQVVGNSFQAAEKFYVP